MLLTAYNQTLAQLADEFIEAVKINESGSEQMRVTMEYMVEQERNNTFDIVKIMESITNVFKLNVNALELDIWKRTSIKLSRSMLSFICCQSHGNTEFITSMVALLGTAYYKEHKKGTPVTLEWYVATVGSGKLIHPLMFFPWFAASKDQEGVSIFMQCTDEDVFPKEHTDTTQVTEPNQ